MDPCKGIAARGATWQHRFYSLPGVVHLNEIAWDVRHTNVLLNAGANTFQPDFVDFASARIINRKGRDAGSTCAGGDALWIQFADNPNGAGAYELEISFGH